MKMEMNEMVTQDEEKEPIYFAPRRVSLVSDVSSILSWVVLVGFVGDFVVQLVSLSGQMKSQSLVLATLLKEPSFYSYVFINMLIPLMTGLVFFLLLQAAAIGLNMLLEMHYNAHDAKK